MGQTNLNLASLIGSRICHDLISPVGAITNGLELLDLAGDVHGPELELIADSVGNAGARIRFFRIAYGAAGEQMLGRPEVVSILDDVCKDGRHSVLWAPLEPQPRNQVRMAFLGIQCLETAMPFGGTVQVLVDNGNWSLVGQADKLTVDETLWAALSNPEQMPEITPALVQFALLPAIAGDLRRSIETDQTESRLTIRF